MALLTDEIESGRKLIEALQSHFPLELAFWVKKVDWMDWRLQLASPAYDRGAEAYGTIISVVESMPELGLDFQSVSLVSPKDSMTDAVRQLLEKKKAYRGMTRYARNVLGGVDVDGAYIYPLIATAAA